MGILLSIIIPTYNTNELTQDLLEILDKQMKDGVEVIVIDDFSDIAFKPKKQYKWLKLIRTDKNGGTAGASRNIGLNIAKGRYIGYIDGDDSVTENYITEILKKINYNKDIIYISWRSKKHSVIIDKKPPGWNCAVWCRVIKKDIIGNIRFREDMKIAEDFVFVRLLKPQSSTSIKKQIYIYNVGREGSLTNG